MSTKIPRLNSGYSGFKWVQVPAQKRGRSGVHGFIRARHTNLAFRSGECSQHREGHALN